MFGAGADPVSIGLVANLNRPEANLTGITLLANELDAKRLDLLRDLQVRHKLAYLFISHDLKVVRALADEVVVLRHGKVVERGSAKQVFEAPQTPYTKALIAAAFNLEAVGSP